MSKLKANVVKLKKEAIVPSPGSEKSAGLDLYACIDKPICIEPGETVKIGTGLAITPPEGYFGAIFARSGMATKQGLAPANKVGVCDEDYTGEYIIPLHNHSTEKRIINPEDRIAQLIFLPYVDIEWEMLGSLKDTKRGNGGFGSTGK